MNNREIFVFGSNEAGRHGKGAALTAYMYYGAIKGQGYGLQGKSFGIPTKDSNLKVLPLNKIKGYVDKFIRFASQNRHMTFRVTPIGTGLAGYSHEDIAPMFYSAPPNCIMPLQWKDLLYIPRNLPDF